MQLQKGASAIPMSRLVLMLGRTQLSLLSLHLLQVCLVYVNTIMIQQVLAEPKTMSKMKQEDFRALTPLIYGHITPYGSFDLDMEQQLFPENDNLLEQQKSLQKAFFV